MAVPDSQAVKTPSVPPESIGPPDGEPAVPRRPGTLLFGGEPLMQRWIPLLVVLACVLLVLALIAVSVRLLMAIGHTLRLFALGGLLAYALDPIVERVRRRTKGRRYPRWVGVLVLFLGLFGLVGLGTAFLGSEAVGQARLLALDHAAYEARGRELLAAADTWLNSRHIPVNLESYAAHPPSQFRAWGEVVAANSVRILGRFTASTLEGAIVLLVALYFLIYSTEMRRSVASALPGRFQPYFDEWRRDVNHILGGFVRGQLVLALTIGTLAALGCAILGVHLWLLIGLFVVVASLVPVFGAYIGALPALIAALLTPSAHGISPVVRAVLVLVLFVLINEIGSKVLYPRLVGAALGLHEVLMLFALLAGLEVAGVWGVLFAAPLVALGVATCVQAYRIWQGEPPIRLAEEAREEAGKAEARGTP